jgi:alcohol dehydrogenase (cytochrome c)
MQVFSISRRNNPAKKVCPSISGGNNFWPSSYSPRTKLLYIPALTGCMSIEVQRNASQLLDGIIRVWAGGRASTDERFESNLTAVDPLSQEIRKNVHLPYPNTSGTLATAGGLIFLGLLDGTVAAFDDTTLDELWKINLGSGFSAPPMSFEVNGKQYVAIASGPSGPSKAKVRNTPELKDQRNATVLYVFGL